MAHRREDSLLNEYIKQVILVVSWEPAYVFSLVVERVMGHVMSRSVNERRGQSNIRTWSDSVKQSKI